MGNVLEKVKSAKKHWIAATGVDCNLSASVAQRVGEPIGISKLIL